MWNIRHPKWFLACILVITALLAEQIALNTLLFEQIRPQLLQLQNCQGREK